MSEVTLTWLRYTGLVCALLLIGTVSSCGKKAAPTVPPIPLDFPLALEYAKRAALAYRMPPFRDRSVLTSRSASAVPFPPA